MPSIDLKYSADLTIDTKKIFVALEDTIKAHDSGTGAAKSRAYPAQEFHHTHFYAEIALLSKDLRDDAWTQKLLADIEEQLKVFLEGAGANGPISYGVKVTYDSKYFNHGKVGA